MQDEGYFEIAEKDDRNRRIKQGDKCKKRENVKEVTVRSEKVEKRQEQSMKDRGQVIQNDAEWDAQYFIEEEKSTKKEKRQIGARLTKSEKQALYEQDENNQKAPPKGKQKQIIKARQG